MAQKKAHEVDGWLARPDPLTTVVLVYGPDRGLVSERAGLFAKRSGLPLDDPFSVIKLDAADADQEGRLLDEARTVSMFSEKRLVWVRGIGSQAGLAKDVAALIAEPPTDTLILLEAGDLKKTSPLRKAAEEGRSAMALPCYADDARGIDSLIDEGLQKAGLRISPEARQLLKANLGGDRLASRGEIGKLALFCTGQQEISVEDVRELIGDVSALNADDIVDAVLCGRLAEFDRLFSRHISGGNHSFVVLAAALRQIQSMQILREQMEKDGKPASAAVASARPPVFFSRRRNVETALQRWSQAMLQTAGDRLLGAILRTRQQPALANETSRQTLFALAIESARQAR